MRLVTWNVNGLRAILTKGFEEYINRVNPDIVCLQEIKLSSGLFDFEFPGFVSYYNYAERKGYSGTVIFSKKEALNCINGDDDEGRFIALEFEKFFVATAYAPNAGRGMDRKTNWDEWFRTKLSELDKSKPIMISGDLNVSLTKKDVWSEEKLEGQPGYTKEERDDMKKLLALKFVDVYRYLYPQGEEYSWWSYMNGDREKDRGMRLDYWIISERITPRVNNLIIDKAQLGSDHAPVILDIAY